MNVALPRGCVKQQWPRGGGISSPGAPRQIAETASDFAPSLHFCGRSQNSDVTSSSFGQTRASSAAHRILLLAANAIQVSLPPFPGRLDPPFLCLVCDNNSDYRPRNEARKMVCPLCCFFALFPRLDFRTLLSFVVYSLVLLAFPPALFWGGGGGAVAGY